MLEELPLRDKYCPGQGEEYKVYCKCCKNSSLFAGKLTSFCDWSLLKLLSSGNLEDDKEDVSFAFAAPDQLIYDTNLFEFFEGNRERKCRCCC